MNRHIPSLSTVVALTFIFILTSCSTDKPTPLRKVTIAQFGDFFLYAPLYVAIDEGLFRDSGLDVSLISTGGDEKTWAAVLGGNASLGVADPTFVAIAGTRGQPGIVVADIVNGVPFWGVTYNEKIPLVTEPNLLKGYSVATFPSPSTAFTLQTKMFRDASLEPNIREGSFGTLLTMIKSNQADIALELEPNVSQAARDGARVLYSLRDLYGPFAVTGVTASPATVANDPQLIRATNCALQKALDVLRYDRPKALAHLSKRFPEITPDVAEAALERIISGGIIPSTLETTPEAWETAITLRRDTGDLTAPAPLEQYVNNTFAVAAAADSLCRRN